jgi:hypothetical protein
MEKDGVFVHVNDSIRKLASAGPVTQTWEFICECPELSCHTLVSLTLSEFDQHRAASPPQPILGSEHANGRG